MKNILLKPSLYSLFFFDVFYELLMFFNETNLKIAKYFLPSSVVEIIFLLRPPVPWTSPTSHLTPRCAPWRSRVSATPCQTSSTVGTVETRVSRCLRMWCSRSSMSWVTDRDWWRWVSALVTTPDSSQMWSSLAPWDTISFRWAATLWSPFCCYCICINFEGVIHLVNSLDKVDKVFSFLFPARNFEGNEPCAERIIWGINLQNFLASY